MGFRTTAIEDEVKKEEVEQNAAAAQLINSVEERGNGGA